MKPLPSQALLLELLDYNPTTGDLTWRPRDRSYFRSDSEHKRWNARYAGKPALNSVGSTGYRAGNIFGITYQTHRIIWKLLHGTDPDYVDHENGIRSDNREQNLRDASFTQNMHNQRKPKNNSSATVGVYRLPNGKWIARICVSRKLLNLGIFPEYADAVLARKVAEQAYNFHPNHGS